MNLDTMRAIWASRILSILRIMSALLLLQFGMAKLLGFPKYDYLNHVEPFSITWIAGALELVGGLLLLVGLFTAPVAFVLSGLMAFAYFLSHAPRGFIPLLNGGNLAVLFCFVLLYLGFVGGGAWSADALRQRKSLEGK